LWNVRLASGEPVKEIGVHVDGLFIARE